MGVVERPRSGPASHLHNYNGASSPTRPGGGIAAHEPETITSSSNTAGARGRVVRCAKAPLTWAWEMPGPPGAPALLLVHGWMATAALNWYGSLDFLGRSFRTVAPNLRGHGRLGRGAPPFSVEACADDLAELICSLHLDSPIVVGYSMGGAVAQVLARRHAELVGGIVLCATAASFARRLNLRPVVRVASKAGAAVARRYPDAANRFLSWQVARHDRAVATRGEGAVGEGAAGDGAWLGRPRQPEYMEWALAERSLSDLATFIEAGAALNAYDSTGWLPDLDVPATIVITAQDRTVAPWRQGTLATLTPRARRYVVDADHDVVVADPDLFLPVLAQACRELAQG